MKNIRKVYVEVNKLPEEAVLTWPQSRKDKHPYTYNVVLVNSENQSMRVMKDLQLRDAMTEASDFADFFGIKLTPFMFQGKVVVPVRRFTYDLDASPPTRDYLLAEYSNAKTKELNWNKLKHWEWARLADEHREKDRLKEWLMPFYMAGPTRAEWLSENCKGVWMPVSGGYRFADDRDAALYRLFHGGDK